MANYTSRILVVDRDEKLSRRVEEAVKFLNIVTVFAKNASDVSSQIQVAPQMVLLRASMIEELGTAIDAVNRLREQKGCEVILIQDAGMSNEEIETIKTNYQIHFVISDEFQDRQLEAFFLNLLKKQHHRKPKVSHYRDFHTLFQEGIRRKKETLEKMIRALETDPSKFHFECLSNHIERIGLSSFYYSFFDLAKLCESEVVMLRKRLEDWDKHVLTSQEIHHLDVFKENLDKLVEQGPQEQSLIRQVCAVGKEVVLIQKDPELSAIIQYNFEAHCLALRPYKDIKSAFKYIESHAPNCVICDIDEITSNELVELRKTSNKEGVRIPLISLSYLHKEEDILRAMKVGVDDYLTKPFSLPVLTEKVMQYVM